MSHPLQLGIVPGATADGPAILWRGLGRPADLDIDFADGDRPALATRVLTTCRADGDTPASEREDEAWGLTLAARIGGLVAVVAETRERNHVTLALHCPDSHCGEAFEVRLSVEALMDRAREAEREPRTRLSGEGGAVLDLRRPTGRDQRTWQQTAHGNEDEAAAAILGSLVASTGDERADPLRVAQAMEAFDPLVCFEVSTRCPGCGRECEVPVDLEAVLLAELEHAQRDLLRDVHRLAAAYGWSEEQVLAVPARRRARYIAMIDEQEGAP